VELPTIDGRSLTTEQAELLRMLVHAMSEAGLSFAMPADMSTEAWNLLHGWIAPLRAERRVIAEQSQAVGGIDVVFLRAHPARTSSGARPQPHEDRCLDRDMAILARSFFDRLTK
jgi:hypothetical protein